MALFFPIIVDTANLRLKELPAGDTLDLTGSAIQTKDLIIDGLVTQTKVEANDGAIDLTEGGFFTISLNAGATVTFSNPPSINVACSFSVEVTNNGGYSISWPASIDWDADIAPTLQDNGLSLFTFYTSDGGTTYRGNLVYVSTT